MTTPEILLTHSAYDRPAAGPSSDRAVLPPLLPLQLGRLAADQAGATVQHWDPSFQPGHGAFEVAVSRLRPRVVLLFAFPRTRREALWMVPVARRSGAAVVVCGPDASLAGPLYLAAGGDAALLGSEGGPFLELLRCLRSTGYRADADAIGHVPGLLTLDASRQPKRTAAPTLTQDPLPPPLRDATSLRIHLERQEERHRLRVVPVRSGDGCPSPCLSCSHLRAGAAARRRSPESVAAEVEELRAGFRWDRLRFEDEIFAHDEAWLGDFRDALGAAPPAIEVMVRPGLLDARIVRRLAALQTVLASVDAPSGSRALLDRLGNPFPPSEIYRTCSLLRDGGVPIHLRVAAGFPGETAADLDQSLSLIDDVDPESVDFCRLDRADGPPPACWNRIWGWDGDGTAWAPSELGARLDAAERWISMRRLDRRSATLGKVARWGLRRLAGAF